MTVIKIVPKIITLLELFSAGEEFSFAEISEKCGLTRSNTSHLLRTMCEEQVLEKVVYGRYRRGPRLTGICMSCNPWEELMNKVSRCADNLMLWMNELAVVGMRDREKRLTLVKRRPEKNIQVEHDGGKAYPADWYSTANGRILLAYAPDEVVRQILRRWGVPDKKVWSEAATLPKLEKELQNIRSSGFVKLRVDDLISAFGVPVRDASGEALLSLSTAFPEFYRQKSDEEIIRHMKFLASTLEDELKIAGIRIIDLKNKKNDFTPKHI